MALSDPDWSTVQFPCVIAQCSCFTTETGIKSNIFVAKQRHRLIAGVCRLLTQPVNPYQTVHIWENNAKQWLPDSSEFTD